MNQEKKQIMTRYNKFRQILDKSRHPRIQNSATLESVQQMGGFSMSSLLSAKTRGPRMSKRVSQQCTHVVTRVLQKYIREIHACVRNARVSWR